jgi:hypothetical protein
MFPNEKFLPLTNDCIITKTDGAAAISSSDSRVQIGNFVNGEYSGN